MKLLDAPKLSLTEAARLLGVNTATLYRWREKGMRRRKLRFVKVGVRNYILRDDLEAWLLHLSDPPSQEQVDVEFAERAELANQRAAAMGL